MKKLIAMLLCLVMVISLFAGCKEGTENPTNGTTTAPTQGENNPPETTAPPTQATIAEGEEITAEPLYYLGFEDDTNITGMVQDRCKDDDGDGVCDMGDKCTATTKPAGGTYGMVAYEGQILHTNGPVGNCLYLDGSYGVKLENLVAPADDSYTISFWVNASRLSDYMPSLQIGCNIGGNDLEENVSWINVTQTNFFGNGAGFPTIWNRNNTVGPDTDGDGAPNGVWPWANKLDDTVYGKNEWIMVTIVSHGETYDHVDATTGVSEPRIAATYYINGVEIMDANATEMTYHGLSPEILSGEGLEGYLGINFWDYTMKGFFDELYIYDEALTAGQVATLWAQGDATVESVVPEGTPDVVEPITPKPIETVTPDANAVEVIGTVDRNNGFWSVFSNGYELADGATVTLKMNNYSNCASNWCNYVICLTNTKTTADKAPSAENYSGYAEYAVFRADSYGWVDGTSYEWTNSWTAWEEWLQLMADAEVTVKMTRNGSTVNVESTFVGADNTTMTSTCVITNANLTADAPCYFFVTGENSYVEILSVE